MIFNLFRGVGGVGGEIHRGKCGSVVYHNAKRHLTGGPPNKSGEGWSLLRRLKASALAV